jgi:hypothetical protein
LENEFAQESSDFAIFNAHSIGNSEDFEVLAIDHQNPRQNLQTWLKTELAYREAINQLKTLRSKGLIATQIAILNDLTGTLYAQMLDIAGNRVILRKDCSDKSRPYTVIINEGKFKGKILQIPNSKFSELPKYSFDAMKMYQALNQPNSLDQIQADLKIFKSKAPENQNQMANTDAQVQQDSTNQTQKFSISSKQIPFDPTSKTQTKFKFRNESTPNSQSLKIKPIFDRLQSEKARIAQATYRRKTYANNEDFQLSQATKSAEEPRFQAKQFSPSPNQSETLTQTSGNTGKTIAKATGFSILAGLGSVSAYIGADILEII